MEIISDINHPALPPSVATIGFFDGVHRGHHFLIDQVKEVAVKEGLCSALVTFPVHPRQVIQTSYCPQLLSSPQEKLNLLKTTGTDYCILLPFTHELSLLSARKFMQLLRDKFNIRILVIGYDHRFGHNRSESFEDYYRYGEELGIYIVRAREYTDGENKISSSVIRRLLKEGDVTHASQFLGYNYYLDGTVVDGYKVGRKIGGKRWAGMLNIGHRPTMNNGKDLSIEVNILHFSDNIYHKKMCIEFVQYLRPEEKFDNIESLICQMHKDREEAAKILL